jgi:ABC-2 type transport system ATP-binding protein
MESVCDRVIIINHGRVLIDQPLAELRRSHLRRKLLTLHTAEPSVNVELPGAEVLSRDPHRISLQVDLDQVPVERVIAHVMSRARLRDLTVSDPPMEDIIRELYSRANLPHASALSPPPGGITP